MQHVSRENVEGLSVRRNRHDYSWQADERITAHLADRFQRPIMGFVGLTIHRTVRATEPEQLHHLSEGQAASGKLIASEFDMTDLAF